MSQKYFEGTPKCVGVRFLVDYCQGMAVVWLQINKGFNSHARKVIFS